jgi:hypothetical protein
VHVAPGGAQTVQSAFTTSSSGAIVANPIAVGTGGGNTYLVLFGTGIAGGGTALTSVTINGLPGIVIYAGSAGAGSGVDQVNVLLPAKLAGAGYVNVQLTTEGVAPTRCKSPFNSCALRRLEGSSRPCHPRLSPKPRLHCDCGLVVTCRLLVTRTTLGTALATVSAFAFSSAEST